MKVLGIESSCDETAAAVVEDGRIILSNIVATQVAEHALYGGVVPEIASRRHTEAISSVVDQALASAGLSVSDIDVIAATAAPGLIGALLVGLNFGKGLAYAARRPLVPVHHIRGHIASNYLAYPELEPPFLCLVVSGGHSLIVDVWSYTEYHVIGTTRDDAAGEAFDKVSRVLGLGYPGGAKLQKLAEGGDETKYKMPHASVSGAPYDFSFSGVKTFVVNLVHNAVQKGETLDLSSLAASFQKTVSDSLVSRLTDAAREFKKDKVAVCGGVSANSKLREDLKAASAQNGFRLFVPPLSLCSDNAAMIASQGYYEFLAGNTARLTQNAYATLEIECSPRDLI